MKILVVSDTHGKNKKLIDRVKKMDKPDLLLHLGDYIGDGLIIAKALGITPIIVMGNGDHPSSGFKEEKVLEIKGKKIYLTHGHRLGVGFNLKRILYRARELGVDIALYGHTHVPLIERLDDIILMNPGSASYPRGSSDKKTFGIIQIDKEIDIKLIEI